MLLVLSSIGCSTKKNITTVSDSVAEPVKQVVGVDFVYGNDLQTVLDKAKAEKKLVFLDFHTTWCLPCRIMSEEVFSLPQTGKMMNENFISYKIDAEKDNGPYLTTAYNVYAYPALIFLNQEGEIIARKDGSLSYSKFINLAQKAIDQDKINKQRNKITTQKNE